MSDGGGIEKAVPHGEPVTAKLSSHSRSYADSGAGSSRDLLSEISDRDCDPNEDEQRSLANADLWTEDVTRRLMVVVEACESVGIPYDLSYVHVDGASGPVVIAPVHIGLTGA